MKVRGLSLADVNAVFVAFSQVEIAVRFAIVNRRSVAAVYESTAVGNAVTVAVMLSADVSALLPVVPVPVKVTGMKP